MINCSSSRLNALLRLMLVLLVITLLTSCDDGKGLILGIMAVGAASGLWQATDDKQDDNKSDTASNSNPNTSPTASADFTIHSSQTYDDLLTAGLGQSGLTNTTPPTATDPSNPTAIEIRQATIFNQYQALQDMRHSSGYGTLYGPTVPTQQFATPNPDDKIADPEGKIVGKEYLAYADDGSGRQNVTMMVQIPADFNPANPCIVAAPSPGSRGVYGAISTVGEWGLKNHCAVAYTDKGTGNGVHDLTTSTVNLIDGTRAIATDAGKQANFIAQGDLSGYNSLYPDRIAQKHAHSQQNPEANWGKNVIDAIQFAFQILNLEENYGKKSTENDDQTAASANNQTTIIATITKDNTIVIAAGISSGGAAALRAAEQDSQNWIDGVVVAAPLINLRNFSDAEGITIQQGNKTFFYQLYNKPLFDVITYYNVYQPCASAANTTRGLPGRCTALHNAGWLSNNIPSEQIIEAQKRLNDYGILESSNAIADYYESASIYAGFAYGYASAYGRFSVVDNLCGYSYAGSQGNEPPSAKSLADLADDFQSSSGMPPSSETQLINNNGNNGKGIDFHQSVDTRNNNDGYLDGALCLRQLATGTTGITINTGVPLTGSDLGHYQRVQKGISETLASGDLRRKPAIIVHGRDDALAPVNFTSRAYYGLNQQTQGANSPLVYLEVKNAHHFDAFNEQYHIDTQIPLYYYLSQSLDRMYDYLKNKTGLPKSQIIRTQPTASLNNNRLPAIDSKETCLITFSNRILTIPEC
jgi:hydroxybutyrate-dimer hydrolase